MLRKPVSGLQSRLVLLLCATVALTLCGCGAAGTGGSSSGSTPTPGTGGGGTSPSTSAITISMNPSSATVRAGTSQKFVATVTGSTNTSVTWSVNGTTNGNKTLGTIGTDGTYTAPATLPSPNSVTIQGTSAADTTVSGSASVTLQNPIAVVNIVNPTTIPTGAFTLTIYGSKFVQGAQVVFGGTSLTTTYVSATQLTATGTASQTGPVAISVVNPDPGSASSIAYQETVSNTPPVASYDAAVRFLEQSTFGPSPQLVAHVQQVGFQGFLNEQFAAPVSTLPYDITTASNTTVQNNFYVNALSGQNQLRQRVAFALGQIFVVSGVKITQDSTNPSTNGLATWQQMLEQDAFSNYSTLLRDVTLSPVMGHYLDMVNNDKPSGANNPNENYAREVLQLFSIGLYQLNSDGSLQTDSSGNPIPTYDQDVIEGFAHLFTGWTYPTKPGATPQKHNPQYYAGPMVIWESNHDTSAKELLNGVTTPAGQNSSQDLDAGLSNIFNHPNVGPFIGKQLILHLVKSNPSPAYVQRIAAVFADDGTGVRGNLQAVVQAILLDPEARAGDDGTPPTLDAGRLREPALYITNVLRGFGAQSDGTRLVGYGSGMGQNILFPDTVFNYFHPEYQIPETTSVGPEFELLGPAFAITRANFVGDLTFSSIGGTSAGLDYWTALAADPNQLLDTLNQLFLHGQMSSDVHDSILTAVTAVPATQPDVRAKQALYLVLTAPQYQVAQ